MDKGPGASGNHLASLASAIAAVAGKADGFVGDLSDALVTFGKIVTIHSGRNPGSAEALERLTETLKGRGQRGGIMVVGDQGNSRGAEAAGCVPNLGPGYAAVGAPGLTTGEMLAAAADGKLDALFIAGANPLLTFPDGALARKALETVPFLAVAEQLLTETAAHAHVVFAAASFAEKRGHVTNLEGRSQQFAQAVEAPVHVATDAAILAAVAQAMGKGQNLSADPDWLYARLAAAQSAAPAARSLARPKVDTLAAPHGDSVDAQRKSFAVIAIPKLYAGGGAAAYDPGLAPMRPTPCAIFHEDDALLLGIAGGRMVTLAGSGGSITVAARVDSRAPAGAVLVIADMPQAPVNLLLDAAGAGRVTVTLAAARAEATA